MNFLDRMVERVEAKEKAGPVKANSLKEFLLNHAKVKLPGGHYGPYSFEGRKVLEHITDRMDMILGSHTGEPMADATFDICGGAQWGKTVWALNTGSYLTSCLFLNWGYWLPDDDLVQGIVDSKLRPDVIEQIDGLAGMMQLGVGEGKNGKKVVNRKGAFMVTDGKRKAFGMIRGLGKIPTSFSTDVNMEDEKDDIPEKNAKFLSGRMTASDLRFSCSIGTQRKHGMGQHKRFMAGTQEVQMFEVPGEKRMINIEERWPEVCRLAVTGKPRRDDPQLTMAGNFKRGEAENEEVFDYDPTGIFYIADPETGRVIDRDKPVFVERRPDRARLRKFSIRVAQVAIAAISLEQPLSRWQDAVKDPALMEVFYCDVLALPKNSSQALTPEILQRSRSIEKPFDLSLSVRAGCKSFAGVDTGNRCWFVAREVESEFVKRVRWAEMIHLGELVNRVVHLANMLDIGCTLVDAHPAVSPARDITYALHGHQDIKWPAIKGKPENAIIKLPGGLTWNGKLKQWQGLRAACVQWTTGKGGGIVHVLGKDEQTGFTKFYPILQVNRNDLVGKAVEEFLTPAEQVNRVKDGKVIAEPVMRLPRREQGSPAIVETLDAHHITGSDKEENGDFVKEVENHLLFANGLSGYAEMMGAAPRGPRAFRPPPRPGGRRTRVKERSVQ